MDLQKLIEKLDRKQTTTILSSAILTVAATWFILKRRNKKIESVGIKEIPTPEGEYFYFGHLPLLISNPSAQITEWHRKLGPIFRIKMGVQNWMFISHPVLAHDIFVTRGTSTSGRPYVTFGNGVHGEGNRGIVFADYGKSWKNTRTAILNILSPKSVDTLQPILERETALGVKLMMQQGEISPLSYTRLMGLNVAIATIFGLHGAQSTTDPIYREVIGNMENTHEFVGATRDIQSFFPAFAFVDFLLKSKKKMVDFVNDQSRPLYRRLIKMARENKQPCLINKLDEIKESLGIDEQNILVLTNELVVASVDTISLAMAWTMALLCRYPEHQKKVIEDLDMFVQLQNRLPLFEDRHQLPYLVAFIKESLRYRSSAHIGLPHKVTEDIVYGDYVIPKDTILFNNGHSSNHDPDFFTDPHLFQPERYLNDTRSIYASSNSSIQQRELFSFGWGRRICPGIYLAENELFNLLVRLLSQCTVEPILVNGKKVYPDLDTFVDGGGTVSPTDYKIRLVPKV
ncbi:hypothetical protein G6F57_004901 [Rhizopus arrhizus]|uniref:Cytochrome P450 n=1 Tax=Rhizopus oryzae TaxID=64495 RepID=A0A9P6X911_RHIOR|nr:hypothetical protein G6F23_001007 [Rhizopus arrhizus]KAG1419771.1 hypothetical protein G6F58_004452 [Rhizopus delemar]KAG0941707.1 hypothetical protein G6F30_006093 [Rhizopus arrhizus]KAG0986960.1 hypothetical protein G6F29_002869 [Rhizopus arrhizus]KAG0994458.1 hypothetical protein G6F28_005722 [Rhizopus arrhizus]